MKCSVLISLAVSLIICCGINNAWASCAKNRSLHTGSTTCWLPKPTPASDHTLVEISKSSSFVVREKIEQLYGEILYEYKNIQSVFDQNKSESLYFYLSHFGANQNDCNIYRMSGQGRTDKDEILESLGAAPKCRETLRKIGRAVSLAMEDDFEFPAMMADWNNDAGAEKMYLVKHPAKELSIEYEKATFSDTYLFDLWHGVHAEKFAVTTQMEVPIQEIVVTKGQTLEVISKKATGFKSNWPTIWALNRDLVDDPNNIKTGMILRMPAYIKSWEPIPADTESEMAANMVYGSSKYKALVEQICAAHRGKSIDCLLPTFTKAIGSAPILTKDIRK